MNTNHELSTFQTRRAVLETIGASGIAATLGSTSVAAQNNDRELWSFETSGAIQRAPTVVDGTAYVSNEDNKLYAVDAETGTEEWVFNGTENDFSVAKVNDGVVYVNEHDNFYALNAETGTVEWEKNFITRRFSPTIANNTIFIGGIDSTFYAMDTRNGEQKWEFETNSGFITPESTIVDDTVFFADAAYNMDNQLLRALDAETGEEQWSFGLDYRTKMAPVVSNNRLFIGTARGDNENNVFYSIDAENGTELWNYTIGHDVWKPPTVADGTVFIGVDSGFDDVGLVALVAADGTERWTLETDDIHSSPTVAGETVFVGSGDNNLYAADIETGEEQWAFETGSSISSSPIVVDGTVYFGSDDKKLYAIDAGVEESSDGSRAQLQILGHHSNSQSIDQSTNITSNGLQEGIMAGVGIAALGAFGYTLKRKYNQNSE